MASTLITCTPAHGHVVPSLAAARHLVAGGHDVRVLTGAAYADRVRATGAEFLPLPAEADIDLDHPNDVFPERAALRGVPEVRFSLTNLFVKPAPAQLRAVDAAIAQRPVDVVVTESMFFGAALLASRPRAERPAIVTLGIVPLSVDDPDVAPFGLGIPPLPGPFGRLRNAFLRFTSEKIVFAPILAAARDAAREALGHVPDLPLFDPAARSELLLQFTVPGFEYPLRHPRANVRFVGPLSRTAPSGAKTPAWWSDLDAGRPVVHVTQGTIANDDVAQLILPTIEGLADEDVLVVVSTGGRPVSTIPGPLPANVRVAEYLPYDLLFPRLAAFVTNGGYGGLHFALEHGVPIVAAGATEDKLETTARVAWSGAGVNLRTDAPTPEAVRAGVRRVLADPSYRAAASRIGAEIAQSPGLAGLDAAIAELTGVGAAG
jgi:Glycosyl transferases, related to UDP-glucuronosyltransferase